MLLFGLFQQLTPVSSTPSTCPCSQIDATLTFSASALDYESLPSGVYDYTVEIE